MLQPLLKLWTLGTGTCSWKFLEAQSIVDVLLSGKRLRISYAGNCVLNLGREEDSILLYIRQSLFFCPFNLSYWVQNHDINIVCGDEIFIDNIIYAQMLLVKLDPDRVDCLEPVYKADQSDPFLKPRNGGFWLVKRLRHTTHARKVPGSIPARVESFFRTLDGCSRLTS